MNVPPRYYDTRYPDFSCPFEFGSNSIMNGVRTMLFFIFLKVRSLLIRKLLIGETLRIL